MYGPRRHAFLVSLIRLFDQQLRKAGKACVDVKKHVPTLIVVVLPEGGNQIYTAVKQ